MGPARRTAGAAIVGRFAPSPTGPLHFGSLFAALASYLDVASRGGRWLVRIEDIDPPREVTGARQAILEALAAHGLNPVEDVIYQSHQAALHDASLQALGRDGHLFYCTCTRKALAAVPGPYPGTCRNRREPPRRSHAVRFRVAEGAAIRFEDGILGPQVFEPGDLGDFIVRRRDGLVAYHLAVVADDAAQGISTILRGADLLDSTPLHICLQHALGHPVPEYLHVPVLTCGGAKLSKQTGAPALDATRAAENLCRALALLGQPVPGSGPGREVTTLLKTACANWRRELVPRQAEIELGPEFGDVTGGA